MKPIFLLGEAYGDNEARINRPFVGASGIELLRMLNESGILELTADDQSYIRRFYDRGDPNLLDCVWNMHPEVYRSNVFMQHPPANKLEHFCGPKKEGVPEFPALLKSKYVRQEFLHELERLADELVEVDPNLVMCLGNSALWALAGKTGVSKLRGTTSYSTHTVTGYKLLPTYHPAAVLRQWELRPVTVMDLIKAKREALYPEIRRPKREIWIQPELSDLDNFYQTHILGCKILSVDIENPGGPISCVGLAPSPALALVVPILKSGRPYWKSAADEKFVVRWLKAILEDPSIKKVFQNGLYDIAVLYRWWGIRVAGADHDTMLCHHALQPEALKGLGFLGSCYADEGAWKSQHKDGTLKRDA